MKIETLTDTSDIRSVYQEFVSRAYISAVFVKMNSRILTQYSAN